MRNCLTILLSLGIPVLAFADPVRFDFHQTGSPTQSGWVSAVRGNGSDGTVSVATSAIGAVTVDTRDRGSANGGGAEAAMWNDFVFANGSDSLGDGLQVSLSGLQPNASYPITIWAFDDSTGGNATGYWNTNILTFPDGPDPTSLSQYTVTFNITTDASGTVAIQGIVGTFHSSGHNVFINGLEVGNRISIDGPTDLTLSNTSINQTAVIGSTVGQFSTTDPTPGDSFIYTLVGGAGAEDNGLFIIQGSDLLTDRDLSTGVSPLSVRVRTTDLEGESYEKTFSITLIDDSDADGLADDWELRYFPDLTTASGAGNNDADSLNNLGEQSRGTNPTLADTDGDGLNDDIENGSGNYVDPTDTGSDPALWDTDGDGLSDGEEVSLANGYVTNPNWVDTDGDQFSDALEISLGTSPTDAAESPDASLALRMNEFLAKNDTGIKDGYGNREDWLEIYNPNAYPVDLTGYHLTDDATALSKWPFPSIMIPAGGYLIVFASGTSGTDPEGNPHANFKLSGKGEYLALVRPGGVIDHQFQPTFPEQFSDISYGIDPGDGSLQYDDFPTPGEANSSSGYAGVVKDTQFSVDRGFFDVVFQVNITTSTPGAAIRYTLDGSKPSASIGTLYTGPIDISTTTNLRAVAYRSGWLSTNVDSHSYLFVNDVATQPTNPPGWPNTWITAPADYEMDPRVDNGTIPRYSVRDALLDIPSISISMLPDDFIGSVNGIYSHPLNRWERECSVEYVHPDGSPGFQENCKIEIHGNSSRNPARMQKHSMRLTFTSTIGVPKLDYPLFSDSPVSQFNKLVLRACFTDSWGLTGWSASRYRPNDSQYFRDVWMKESLRDMEQPSSFGNYVHLYVNGLYFGLHNLTERLEDDFFADHLGGDADDWEVFNDFGNPGPRWLEMMAIANGPIETQASYDSIKDYIDLKNYADYMLLHYYSDAEDWPSHNGYAAVNAVSGDGKYRFFVWDQEIALDKFSWNRYSDARGGAAPFQRLRLNDEFLILFADRVQKQMFNGGALSEGGSITRYAEVGGWIDKAIVAESARWGDTQDTTSGAQAVDQPSPLDNVDHDAYPEAPHAPHIYFTREESWLVELNNVINHYIPTLHDQTDSRSIIRELRANNLFPDIDAPVFSQHGGDVPVGYPLQITADTGTAYYTLDGSDPRLTGGALNPNAGMLTGGGVEVALLNLESSGWRYLDTGVNLGDSDIVVGHGSYSASHWKHPSFDDTGWAMGQAILGYGSISDATVNTVVGYGGDASDKHETTYFRKSFSVTGASEFTALKIDVLREDGAILYLNGREIVRTNVKTGNVTFTDLALVGIGGTDEKALHGFMYELSAGDLVEGVNILTVEIHQSSLGSSDLGVDVKIRGVKPQSGPNEVTINQSGIVRSRAFNNGEWSALVEAWFTVGQAAASSNLVVSEIMYHPIGGGDHEYIELMNTSTTETIDLSGVQFVLGIQFTFPENSTLGAQSRLLLVSNTLAFEAEYGAGHPVAGQYTGHLADSGEQLVLQDRSGADIRNFIYRDQFPWPESVDGDGFSLVLIDPVSRPPHGDPASWRASVAIGGTPTGNDASSFSGDPDVDADSDGLSAFLEYALGSDDLTFSPEFLPTGNIHRLDDGTHTGTDAYYLTLSFSRNLAAEDVVYEVQVSDELQYWRSGDTDVVFISRVNHGDGTETITYRNTQKIGGKNHQFIRLKVTEK